MDGQAQGDRLAIKMLVAAGFVTEAKANEALNIAHCFDKGPLTQAQGGGEVRVCKWHQQDEGYDTFSTSCGHEYSVNDCTDGNVQLPFCPFCARPLQGIAWSLDDEETLPAALSQQPAAVDGVK